MSKVSLIVPVYNTSKYLEKCINSLINQTLDDIEIILVNDGSTDNSRYLIDSFCCSDSRFKLICNDNHGLSYSRNYGINAAYGEYILPLDSDDYIEHTYLERAMTCFKQHPEITLYYGKWKFIGYNAEMMNQRFGKLHYRDYKTLLISNSIHCSCVYRKKDAVEAGLYDETMKAYEDWEFLIRLLSCGKYVAYDKKDSLFYRQFEHSMSSYGHEHYADIYNYIRQKNKKIYDEVLNG